MGILLSMGGLAVEIITPTLYRFLLFIATTPTGDAFYGPNRTDLPDTSDWKAKVIQIILPRCLPRAPNVHYKFHVAGHP